MQRAKDVRHESANRIGLIVGRRCGRGKVEDDVGVNQIGFANVMIDDVEMRVLHQMREVFTPSG
ncbi:hypothetical protein D3C71_2106150 [compost metagenome]